MAINLFEQFLDHNEELQRSLWTLSGTRLLRHCALSEACHAAALILKFAELYQPCDDRDSSEQRPPTEPELVYLAQLREPTPSSDGSSGDEDAEHAGAGWCGERAPLLVGSVYTARRNCDGQGLASPGQWPVSARRYPTAPLWQSITALFQSFTNKHGTPKLFMELALGRGRR